MKYTILRAGSYEKLIALVNEYISQGWEPQGGVTLNPWPLLFPSFFQPMILRA